MRTTALVLLIFVIVGCKSEHRGADGSQIPLDGTSSSPAAITATAATTASDATAARPVTPESTSAAQRQVPVANSAAPAPFDFRFDEQAPAPAQYEYLVDTLYDWKTRTQRIVVSKTALGVHVFNLENRAPLEKYRVKHGYEKVGSWEVPAAKSDSPNPFINAKRVVILYRKPR